MNADFEKIAREVTERIHAGHPQSAITMLEEIRADWQEHAEYWANLGQAYLAAGRTFDAQEALALANQHAPTFASLFNLAESAFIRGDYLLAAQGFRDASGTNPENPAFRGIAAFKVILSESLSGNDIPTDDLEAALVPEGKLYLEIFRRLQNSDSTGALAFLELPAARSPNCAPYLDSLITAHLISVESPES